MLGKIAWVLRTAITSIAEAMAGWVCGVAVERTMVGSVQGTWPEWLDRPTRVWADWRGGWWRLFDPTSTRCGHCAMKRVRLERRASSSRSFVGIGPLPSF